MWVPRAPWWMYACAVAFLGQYLLTAYSTLLEPSTIGVSARDPGQIRYEFQAGQMVATYISSGSSAERGGVRAGDRILTIDGQPVRSTIELARVLTNLAVGQVYPVRIERAGQPVEASMSTAREPFRWTNVKVAQAAILASQCLMLLLGFAIGFARPNDPNARLGALMLATFGAMYFVAPTGMVVVWRHLPAPASALLWIPRCAFALVGAIVFLFCTGFPRGLFRSDWTAGLLAIPAVLDAAGDVLRGFVFFSYPAHWEALLNVWPSQIHFPIQSVYALGGLAAMGWNYRRLTDQNERRRVRIIFAGLGITIASTVPVPISDYAAIYAPLRSFFLSPPYAVARAIQSTTAPLSIAYAILRHRLFDIRVVIRRGIQYALARGATFSVAPILGVALVFDLVRHGDEPLVSILAARGWLYLGFGVLAIAAHWNRSRWLEGLDRRFFREQYDARHILQEVVQDVAKAVSFERVAAQVVGRIESALHPEFAALLMRRGSEPWFRSLAVAPADGLETSLPTESKVIGLVRVLGKPVQWHPARGVWLKQQLPAQEIDSLRQKGIELLAPIISSAAGTEALLVLGAKRSEEPYSGEDLELLTAVTTSLGLLLSKPVSEPGLAAELVSQRARETADGSLAGRDLGPYRVLSLVGAGGMGRV